MIHWPCSLEYVKYGVKMKKRVHIHQGTSLLSKLGLYWLIITRKETTR